MQRGRDEKQEEVAESVAAIKQSIVKLSHSDDPMEAEVIGSLVVDQQTAKGISRHQRGGARLTIGTWRDAQRQGSRDATLALEAAGVGGPVVFDRFEVTGSRIVEVPWWERLKFWNREDDTESDQK